ncbi:hypothetical protein [Lewinella sp. LCG006]|uniref:hypothetical protein n=1 Tax=Lewinella sp. LCG006 TaxID=3231911 RepID=UPI0034608447
MNWILFALSGYDPDKEARKPRAKTDNNKKRSVERTTDLPEDVKTNPITKKTERYIREDEDTHTWQQVDQQTGFGQRSSTLLPEEIDFLRTTKHYLVEKGEVLKVYWATGLTPRETAQQFTERGYSYETIRLYFRLFNRYEATPTEEERGSAQEGG